MQTLTGDIKLLFKPGTKTGEPAQDGSPFKHRAPSSGAPGPGPRSPLLSRVQGRRLAPGVPAWGEGPSPTALGPRFPLRSLSPPLPTLAFFFVLFCNSLSLWVPHLFGQPAPIISASQSCESGTFLPFFPPRLLIWFSIR